MHKVHLPRSASWIEEMEERSRRRIRDLVALAAFQGLSQNEIGCARISMKARSTNAPFKGRIQKRKTNHLQIITFGLQRTAGPYQRATSGRAAIKLQFAGVVFQPVICGAMSHGQERTNRDPIHASSRNSTPHNV